MKNKISVQITETSIFSPYGLLLGLWYLKSIPISIQCQWLLS